MTTNLGPHQVPTSIEFESFRKIPRLSREIVITEKIDGTNAQILIAFAREVSDPEKRGVSVVAGVGPEPLIIFAGSRNRWIQPGNDNFGFAAWVRDNAADLATLGPGRHFGEWFGSGIQRGYGLKDKRFALFNAHQWIDLRVAPGVVSGREKQCPVCCTVVPILYVGQFTSANIESAMERLAYRGSYLVPGFDKPEGIVIYHHAGGYLFKKTFEGDEYGKGE